MSSDNPTWTPLDSHREMKVVSDGKILVVRPSNSNQTVVPLFCPLCGFPLGTQGDAIAFRTGQCCEKCFLFCRGKKEEMPPGQWEDYLLERQNTGRPLFNLK